MVVIKYGMLNKINDIVKRIFTGAFDFEQTALEVFQFQYNNNEVYKSYVDALGIDKKNIKRIENIPFLPVQLFKNYKIISTDFQPQAIFESSGTTTTINSKHYVKDLNIYEKSFRRSFYTFYENADEYCVIGLLPSYLERKNSSLVYMVDRLIADSKHEKSGFYLNEFDKLAATLKLLESKKQKTILIGVTFALLDFAAQYPIPLKHTIIMETGGMKGRREEILKEEVHDMLKKNFQVNEIHSEYGMTELLSQAYSKGNGIFYTPAWMKILIREEDDPFNVKMKIETGRLRGKINVIDLANIYSCSFIATDDVGFLHKDDAFEVIGRADHSDIRGCSLLAL